MQSVRFVLRTVCPRLINPYDLSTPNQGSPYNLSPYGLSKANQSKKAVRTICLPYDLSADRLNNIKRIKSKVIYKNILEKKRSADKPYG